LILKTKHTLKKSIDFTLKNQFYVTKSNTIDSTLKNQFYSTEPNTYNEIYLFWCNLVGTIDSPTTM